MTENVTKTITLNEEVLDKAEEAVYFSDLGPQLKLTVGTAGRLARIAVLSYLQHWLPEAKTWEEAFRLEKARADRLERALVVAEEKLAKLEG